MHHSTEDGFGLHRTIQQRMDLVCTGLFFVGEVGAHVVAKGRCIQT